MRDGSMPLFEGIEEAEGEQEAPPAGDAGEEWREVPGFPGYEVSNLGRARTWWKPGGRSGGRKRRDSPKLMSGTITGNFVYLCIRDESGNLASPRLDRLILEAFAGPGPEGSDPIRLSDPSPANNRLDNLAWGDPPTDHLDLPGEEWKPLPDHPGFEVSSRGRVRSWWHQFAGKGGRRIAERPTIHRGMIHNGEPSVIITRENGKRDTIKIGQLVLSTFVGPCHEGCHFDRGPDPDPWNNAVDNIRWRRWEAGSIESEEEWRGIPGYPGYEVSDLGKARSWWKGKGPNGGRSLCDRSKPVSVYLSNGQPVIKLNARVEGECLRRFDTLILELFVGPCPLGYKLVRGPDSDPRNNRVDNLRWEPAGELAGEIDGEEWCPIEGYPGYEVSSIGRIRSFWGRGARGQGRRMITDTPRVVGGYVAESGHRGAAIYRNGERRPKRVGVHILVAEAFIGPRPEGMWVCHNDGNPANNRVENLRYDTPRENNRDVLRHGRHNSAVLTGADIPEVWRMLCEGKPVARIAKWFGVTSGSIARVRDGQAWTHITEHLPGFPRHRKKVDTRPAVYAEPEACRKDIEIWREIPGWPAYQISNFGRVQTRLEKAKGGARHEFRYGEWRDRKINLDKDGYSIFSVGDGKGNRSTMKLHRAVLMAFAGPCPIGMFACHIDGDRTNNHAGNLRWDTARENHRDWRRHRAANR